MIKALLIILAVLVLIIGFLAFLINHERKKNEKLVEEKAQLKKDLDLAESEVIKQEVINKSYIEAKKENEEIINTSSAPDLDGFNAGLDLLHKLAKGD